MSLKEINLESKSLSSIYEELRQELDVASRAPLTLKVSCQRCLFYRKSAVYGKPCSQLGVLEKNEPCAKYTADVTQLLDEEGIPDLLRVIRKLNTSKLELLASMLVGAKKVAKSGFDIGETVYFKIFQGDYLSNYVKGNVIAASKNVVHILGTRGFTASLQTGSLITKEDFLLIKEGLIKANKINDPNHSIIKKEKRLLVKYDAPLYSGKGKKKKSRGDIPMKTEYSKVRLRG